MKKNDGLLIFPIHDKNEFSPDHLPQNVGERLIPDDRWISDWEYDPDNLNKDAPSIFDIEDVYWRRRWLLQI